MSKRKKEKYVAVLAVCTKQVFIFFFFPTAWNIMCATFKNICKAYCM